MNDIELQKKFRTLGNFEDITEIVRSEKMGSLQ